MAQPTMRARKFERHIGIGVETTFGTIAAASVWVPGKSTLKSKPGFAEADNPVGTRGESRVVTEVLKVAGGLTLECAPGCMTEILSALDLMAGSTSLFTSLTVYESLGTEWWVTTGVSVNKFTFNMARAERASVELDVFAQQRRRGAAINGFSAPTPDYGDFVAPYIYSEFTAKQATAAEDHIWTCKLEIDQMLKDDEYQSNGTGLVRCFPSDGQKVTLTLDHVYEHADFFTGGMAGTEYAWEFKCLRGTDTLVITVPRTVVMEGIDPDEADSKQPLQLKGLVPYTEGTPGEVVTVVEDTVGS